MIYIIIYIRIILFNEDNIHFLFTSSGKDHHKLYSVYLQETQLVVSVLF